MNARHQVRRDAALAVRIASQAMSGERRLGITDAAFNFREIAKQMLLLEDHLFQPHKFCPDCIRKHLLTIEALAEEAVTLGTELYWEAMGENMAEQARKWLIEITDGSSPPAVAGAIREFRKFLTGMVYDPRDLTARVASLHLARQHRCPHRA